MTRSSRSLETDGTGVEQRPINRSKKSLTSVGNYRMIRELGKGNFATVKEAIHEVLKIRVAIKIIDTNTVREPYVIKNLTREAKLLAKLQHPSIVCLYETIRCNSSYYLVTELATGGDLYTHIRKQPTGHLDESTAKSYARQLVSALNHIHLKGIVHRDLKMENIMLRDARKKHIKIIDFGLSNWSTGANHLETHCGSPEYAAPELFLEGQKYGPEVDLWSLGVILYGMVTGELPFLSPRNDRTSAEEWRRKLMTQIFRGLTTLQEKKISTISRDYKNLVRRLLEPVAHRRIPMIEIFRHPWLYDRNKNLFDVTYQTRDNFKSDALRSIFQEINAATRLNDANINEKIRLKPYGDIGGMFNIKAHKLLGTGSIDVFEAPSSSIGQKIRTVGRLLSRESSSRISSTRATAIPNNTCLRSPTSVSNENRSRSPISETAKKNEKNSSKRSFSNCNTAARSNCTVRRTLSQQRESNSEKSGRETRGAVATSTSNGVSISTRPMTQPLILKSPARQLSSSLTKPTNYSRYRPSCTGPSILSRDQSYVKLRRSLENKDKIYQQRYSTPDVGTCTRSTEKDQSTRVHKIGRVVMPLVSKNWHNSRLLSSAGKTGSRNVQDNEIFSNSITEKYEKYHENSWTNSRLLTRGKTFLWSKNIKNLTDTTTKNSVKN